MGDSNKEWWMAAREAESQISGQDLSLGCGCFGIHPRERMKAMGVALAGAVAKSYLGDKGVQWLTAWLLAAARPGL